MWIKRNVVMLPTNEKAQIGDLFICNGILFKPVTSLEFVNKMRTDSKYWIPQHLYILSDEEIKEERLRWSIDNRKGMNGFIHQVSIILNSKLCPEIITTTDKSLHTGFAKTKCPECDSLMKLYLPDHVECTRCGQSGWNLVQGVYSEICRLPQIPQSFIEYFVFEYNKGNIITEVMVEYEEIPKYAHNFPPEKIYNLKINPDNTINIKPVKDSWNRDEVEKLCSIAYDAGIERTLKQKAKMEYLSFEQWLEENL